MSELRQNLATKEWFVIATERAKRPKDFKKEKVDREDIPRSPKCPFCPGNEDKTPMPALEIFQGDQWLIRSVPNKFSAFQPQGDRERIAQGIYRKMNGVGIHEVIIESPLHNHHYHIMTDDHLEQIVKAYLNRYLAAMEDDRVEAVILFKNYGPTAGCSLAHPHAQMIATPVVPTFMRNDLEQAKRFTDDTGKCAYCVMMNDELKEEIRIVAQNDSFVVFCPYACGTPFETWIMPKRHEPSFGNINPKEIRDLGILMKDLFSRYYYGLDDPDFNFAIQTPPRDESNDRSYHWYIRVMPRLTKLAGFELGSGMMINVTLPEENAKYLREAKIPMETPMSLEDASENVQLA